ncbi:unnamed protein product [Trichobilharzia regenti]|nr:unnamed protein product [Trichobilharzia regenti]
MRCLAVALANTADAIKDMLVLSSRCSRLPPAYEVAVVTASELEFIQNHIYPQTFYKSLRKDHLRPTRANLYRLAESHLCSETDEISNLCLLSSKLISVQNDLNFVCYLKFTKYLHATSKKTKESEENN